ncbi:Six-hairpin glycosidase-like protein [Cladochytrium replicatum]|nr:Six-hairpin glycosidase-like protein [Cladochytrium replicatum]
MIRSLLKRRSWSLLAAAVSVWLLAVVFIATGVPIASLSLKPLYQDRSPLPTYSHPKVVHDPLSLQQWFDLQLPRSASQVLQNIRAEDSAKGCVIASPSRKDPDYFYHWVRDAALVMLVPVRYYIDRVVLANEKYSNDDQDDVFARLSTLELESIIWDHLRFSRKLQLTPNRSNGLGEPKFNVDGSAYEGHWGRPQNDGPALRAITATLFTYAYLRLHNHSASALDRVRSELYNPSLPATTLIKSDLEYVAHHWNDDNEKASYDLWEETPAQMHFYNLVVQACALRVGAAVAEMLADPGAAAYYRAVAKEIKGAVVAKPGFWDESRGYFVASVGVKERGQTRKVSGMDVAVLLAMVQITGALEGLRRVALGAEADALGGGGGAQDPVRAFEEWTGVDPCGERGASTVYLISRRMRELYPVNSIEKLPALPGRIVEHSKGARKSSERRLGPGIGRYPEDEYDGVRSGFGNAWVLATAGVAEHLYMCAVRWEADGRAPEGINKLAKFIFGEREFNIEPDVIPGMDEPEKSDDAEDKGRPKVLSGGFGWRNAWKREMVVRIGDTFMRRVQFHAPEDGGLSEQIDRMTGFMRGARELTWSHVSVITAVWRRESAVGRTDEWDE